jgi:hypothetical protein
MEQHEYNTYHTNCIAHITTTRQTRTLKGTEPKFVPDIKHMMMNNSNTEDTILVTMDVNNNDTHRNTEDNVSTSDSEFHDHGGCSSGR